MTLMRNTFGVNEMRAMCATLSVSVCDATPVMDRDDTEHRNLIAEGHNSIQVWQANSLNRSTQPYMSVNGTEIGRSAVPSELIRVNYMGRSVFVQILYDEGSQVTLVNNFCEPLTMNIRQTEKPVRITGVVGESFEVRKILRLYLREHIQIEGILVPYLAINPTTVKRPLCL